MSAPVNGNELAAALTTGGSVVGVGAGVVDTVGATSGVGAGGLVIGVVHPV